MTADLGFFEGLWDSESGSTFVCCPGPYRTFKRRGSGNKKLNAHSHRGGEQDVLRGTFSGAYCLYCCAIGSCTVPCLGGLSTVGVCRRGRSSSKAGTRQTWKTLWYSDHWVMKSPSVSLAFLASERPAQVLYILSRGLVALNSRVGGLGEVWGEDGAPRRSWGILQSTPKSSEYGHTCSLIPYLVLGTRFLA